MSIVTSIDNLIAELENLPETKRFKELEKGINENPNYLEKVNNLKKIQKQMILAQHNQKSEEYNTYKREYEEAKNELYELPFFAEYLDLIDYLNGTLKQIEKIINDGLKG